MAATGTQAAEDPCAIDPIRGASLFRRDPCDVGGLVAAMAAPTM